MSNKENTNNLEQAESKPKSAISVKSDGSKKLGLKDVIKSQPNYDIEIQVLHKLLKELKSEFNGYRVDQEEAAGKIDEEL